MVSCLGGDGVRTPPEMLHLIILTSKLRTPPALRVALELESHNSVITTEYATINREYAIVTCIKKKHEVTVITTAATLIH